MSYEQVLYQFFTIEDKDYYVIVN